LHTKIEVSDNISRLFLAFIFLLLFLSYCSESSFEVCKIDVLHISGLLKPAGYNPYPVPAVPVSVSGYRRVNKYGFEKGWSHFFLEKTRCTRRPVKFKFQKFPPQFTSNQYPYPPKKNKNRKQKKEKNTRVPVPVVPETGMGMKTGSVPVPVYPPCPCPYPPYPPPAVVIPGPCPRYPLANHYSICDPNRNIFFLKSCTAN
jgi:hypothetical protein